MPPGKHPSSFRLSPECHELIKRLAETLGISQAGVIEQAVRKLARAELAAAEPEKPRTRRKPPAKE